MKALKNVLLGIALIALGVIFALNALGIISVDLFFEGWWTLFIIVPSFFGLFSKNDRIGAIFGLLIGIAFLLAARDIIDFDLIWKLILPAVLIFAGIKIVFGKSFKKKEKEGRKGRHNSIFASENANFDGHIIKSTEFNCVFGELQIFMGHAILESDVTISINNVFGSTEIKLPDGVNVSVSSSTFLGDVEHKISTERLEGAYTVNIKANCVFGEIVIL